MNIHKCHAAGCEKPVQPKVLMCRRHWSMVPRGLQRRVWTAYRPGQERDKRPSEEWRRAAAKAIQAVRQIEEDNRAHL